MAEKPWGGRFREETLKVVERFTASIGFDRRLYRQDIRRQERLGRYRSAGDLGSFRLRPGP